MTFRTDKPVGQFIVCDTRIDVLFSKPNYNTNVANFNERIVMIDSVI